MLKFILANFIFKNQEFNYFFVKFLTKYHRGIKYRAEKQVIVLLWPASVYTQFQSDGHNPINGIYRELAI